MEKELCELRVRVVVLDQDVILRQVLLDRLCGAFLTAVDRVVD